MESYKQEFIEFMVEHMLQEHSFVNWESIMRRQFMTTSDLILTYCLDRLTREFPFQ